VPQQGTGVQVGHRNEVELQGVGDAHAACSSEGPDRVAVELLLSVVRGHPETTAAVDVVDGSERAAGQTVAADQPADASPERVAGHGHGRC
jgi:hypothetical protein